MAMPSNKSSSPSMIAGRTSPNSRNSEVGNPVRRSFSGNPFTRPSIVANPRSLNPVTPANSPSDYPRRNSVSREILFTSRDNEEKENGKDQNPKPIRVRSPTVGKSSKHFMSPTISAASKIAVSPKKKILGDLNESVRSSLSFSGTKSSSLNSVNPSPEAAATAVESDTNPEIVPISNSSIAAPAPKSSRTVRFAGFEVISDSYDDAESSYRYGSNPEVVTVAVETDMKPEIAPISSLIVAQASKTVRFSDVEVISASEHNFESPAKTIFTEELDCVNLDPSFKISPVSSTMVAPLDADRLMPPYDPKTNYLSPRPQFLHYRPNRRIERGSRLEEFFSSVNVTESEFSEETEPEDSQKESDEFSSNGSEQGAEEVEEKDEEIIHISEQETIEVKKSTRMFKISSLLLILSIAFFSICAVVRDPNISERSSLLMVEHPSEIYEFAKMNFNVLVGKLEVWHANSIASISHVVSKFRGAPSLIYLNHTEFLYKDVDEQCLVLSHQTLWEKESNLNVIKEATNERENGIEYVETEDHGEEEEEESLQEIEVMKEIEAKNEEEEEQLLQEMEAKASYPEDGEENDEISAKSASEESLVDTKENDDISAKSASEESLVDTKENDEISAKSASEESLVDTKENDEISEKTASEKIKENDEISAKSASEESLVDTKENDEISAKTASEKIDEEDAQKKETEENYEGSSADFEILDQSASDRIDEDDIHENETKENYEVSSADFETLDQIEPEAETGETEEENNDSQRQQQSNTAPVFFPPSAEPQSDFESSNGGNIKILHGISGDFTHNTMLALLLSLIIPAGLIYAKKSGSKPTIVAVEEQKQPLMKEEEKKNHSPEEEEEAADDEHDDLTGESCSSEMSSFQYSSMRGAGAVKEPSETQSRSHVRRKTMKNSRRESLASSSSDEYSISASPSPSYGSFTTYERIKQHQGNGEEEIMTPVRRSNRIRQQAQ